MNEPEGLPEYAEHSKEGRAAEQYDQWTLGPFRFRRSAVSKKKPWLAEAGGEAATAATPYEASMLVVSKLGLRIGDLERVRDAAEDTISLLEELE